jgi:HSP20 family molecular chaperone IbpA
VIRLELAGVDRENIEITLHDNKLNVSELTSSSRSLSRSLYIHERFYGASGVP